MTTTGDASEADAPGADLGGEALLDPSQYARLARLVFDALDAGVLLQGPLGRVAAANPAAARILDLHLDALVGAEISALTSRFRHEDGSLVESHDLPGVIAHRTGEVSSAVLLQLATGSGSTEWVEVTAQPLHHRRDVVAVVWTLRDVTKRQRAEQRLRETERRQRVVLEHAVGGYAIVADDGSLVGGSSSMLGWWRSREPAGLAVGRDFLHADDRDVAGELIEQAKASPGHARHAEVRASDDRGLTRWLELTATDRRDDPAVGGIVVNFTDITERKQAEQALAHQAVHDPVTGLPNRRLLTDRLGAALARADELSRRVAILFFDVDHFKLVNDSLGHPAGDLVLQQMAGRFRAAARLADTVVRFGGDEFVVVCEDLNDLDEAVEIARRLTSLVERPLVIDRSERVVTVSCGVAISEPGMDAATLVRDADAAMNLAKERGRARIEVFSDELRGRATRELDLETSLHRALDRGELRLVYQPVIDLETERMVGCEALLRWDHHELGAISPVEFIPLAERAGLIVPIGAWVLREAIDQLMRWTTELDGAEPEWVAVNLSARQLGWPELVPLITDALHASGLAPGRLHLEVTESALVDDLAASIQCLDQLKELGVHVDIDDFGTGYSSLSYLKRLPIDTLKIDRSFTDGLGADPHDTSIVHAIVSLSRALDLDLIAEGVETADQRDELRSLGCGLGQGFYWSKPLDPDQLAQWRPATA
jgi:diguanylate cyclase (GGDEF)-like protein/PAS domain S-box-containing protein